METFVKMKKDGDMPKPKTPAPVHYRDQSFTLLELLRHNKTFVSCVHARECPYWHAGKSHGPCECGAKAAQDQVNNYIKMLKAG